MLYSSAWGDLPGIGSAVETYEAAIRWGPTGMGLITGGYIASGTLDPTNSPTTELRVGLVLGQKTADGTWTNYAATNTDGSEVATGVLITSLRMTDFQNVAKAKFYGILVGGPVKAANLLGLDLMARQQMGDYFKFDDALAFPGNHWYPWKRFVTKTANYQVLASDNFTLFDNVGATGEVDFTLPAIANGYFFGFRAQADQILKVISSEGTNIVAINNASATSVAFSTGSQKIGGMLYVYSNPAGTKWIIENASAGVAAITVA